MDPNSWILIRGAVLILLPLVPAVILFKLFPTNSAAGAGTFAGMKWKFGGAFCAYAFLLLVLYTFFIKVEPEPAPQDQLWEIEGVVELQPKVKGTKPIELKTLPERFQVDSNGRFKLLVAARNDGAAPNFPSLVVESNVEGYPTRTYILSQGESLFGGSEVKLEFPKGKKNKALISHPIVITP
ncbi:MAG: hypothetical protein ING75_03775 [Rhodocyclaceae bacterium]|nr:hypothetical protein [Rhodocyclaceae bacterium]